MTIQIKDLGIQEYLTIYDRMREFNDQRDSDTHDEIWLLEHPPVYTLGLAGKIENLLNTKNIPVINTDRGGQVTYHGPGQLIVYLLIDIKQQPYSIKKFVSLIEKSIIDCLGGYEINAERISGSPGVYVNGEKIAALGVRIKRGCTYHGLALNIDMDLKPFEGINPCGHEGLVCTQLLKHKKGVAFTEVKRKLTHHLIENLDKPSDVLSDVA